MSTNFTNYYVDYYNQIKRDEPILEYKKDLDDCLDVIVAEMGTASGSIQELQGDYSQELITGVTGIVNESNIVNKAVGTYLKKTLKVINELSEHLEKFRDDDEKLELKQEELKQEKEYKSMEIDKLDPDSEKYKELYSEWSIRVDKIDKEITTLFEIVKSDKEECDKRIRSVKKFNDDLINIRSNVGYIRAMD